MARTPATTDYGAPPARSNKMHRPLLLANHILHFISSIIVMSIAAYFIRHFSRNTHLLYWVALAAIDALLYLPALVLPALKSYKGYLAPLAWILSYLWLTAFIFAAQDYRHGNCVWRSPAFVNKCRLKRVLEAFAFLAFFTSLIGTILEGRLWDINRLKGTNHANKHHTAATPLTAAPAAPTATAPHTAV